ncbi:MAG: FliA/WhiG family RNA polymerase sigma factor [Planctomycetes bacterium]|nr:FliA/WhiG family RNA polymerase sigma factor [Planctomycetota bacterium]
MHKEKSESKPKPVVRSKPAAAIAERPISANARNLKITKNQKDAPARAASSKPETPKPDAAAAKAPVIEPVAVAIAEIQQSAPPPVKDTKTADQSTDELWRTYKKTLDKNLRNLLIEKYYPMVRHIAERVLQTLPKSIDVDELCSAGVTGLMDAINGFDLERGIKFKTYCTTRIRGSILDHLRAQDFVPRLVRLKAHRVERAVHELEAKLGRRPTDFELAQHLKIPLARLETEMSDSSPKSMLSLSDRWDDDDEDRGAEKADLLEDKRMEDPIRSMQRKDLMEVMTRNLTNKERQIFVMYYEEGHTMREIGEILKLTESRVCQIHSNVVARLKGQLDRMRATLLT